MTVYTRADLASKALRQPGLYAPDEDIAADDQEEAEIACESLVDTLAELKIFIPNGSVDVVPSAWYLPLANYVGLFLLQSYGGGAPTADTLQGALAPLRMMSEKPATGAVMEAEYL